MHTGTKTASPYIIGVPVPPQGFYGYEDQVAQFFRQCISGPVLQPTRILGLRRSGKTSFLKYISAAYVPEQLPKDIEKEQLLFAYLDLEFVSTPVDFFLDVAEAIQENCPGLDVQPQELTTARGFNKWLKSFFSGQKAKKLIILLDEFERIHAEPNFDSDFFGFLRSLASSHADRLTWVTASAVDLHTLDKNEKTSPLWNIFRNTPIMMGGLGAKESESLVRKPAQKMNIEFTDAEVSEILSLAGKIPYFIQAVADEWFQCRSKDISFIEVKDQVIENLTQPANQVQRILHGYWTQLLGEKSSILTDIAAGSRKILRNSNAYYELIAYGLIQENGSSTKISGELLKQFILSASLAGKTEVLPVSPSQQSDPVKRGEPGSPASMPSINVFIDSSIGQVKQNDTDRSIFNLDGTYVGGNVNVTNGNFAGRDMTSQTGLDAGQVEALFEMLFTRIDSHPRMNQQDKSDVKLEIEEVRQELVKKEQANETVLIRHLRNIRRMAPDILEVTLATITNPVAGFGMVAKKIAEKMRSTAE